MARLTKAPKPKLPLTDKRRRHLDPPALWLAVATSSVVFHLLLAVIILPLQAQRAGEEPQLDPVAIDLVEINPVVEAPVAIAPSTQSDAVNQQPEPQLSPPAQSSQAFPSPPPELSPEPLPEPSTEPPVEEPPPVPPASSESGQPTNSVSPENPDSGETDSNQTADADDTTPAPVSPDNPAAEGEDANLTSPTGDSGLPGVTVDSTVNPTGWVTTAIVSQRPDRPFDVPTQLATVKPGRDRLPDPTNFGCPVESGGTALTAQEQYAQYLAEAAPYLNTSVNVNITVEADGRVSEAYVGDEGNSAYEQLAVCLVTNWLEFNPALRDGVPWASDNQQVTITISSIQ